MADNNTKIAKNTLFLSIRMAFTLSVSLYTSRIFLNVLGVVDYGISNVVAGFVSMFSFLNTSLSNGIQRFYNAEKGKRGKQGVTIVYNTSLIIQSILALLVFLLLETVGLWYLYEIMVIPAERLDVAFWLFQFSVVSAVVVILQAPYSAAIMAYERMDYFAFVSIFDAVLKLVFAFILPYIPADYLLMYGLFYLLIALLTFILYLAYSKKNFTELRMRKVSDKGMFRDVLSFSGWNFLGTFACMAREQGLNMVLNLFCGPVVNAARGVAYQVSGALQGFVSTLSMASKPQMVQSYATGDSTRTLKLMYTMSKLSFVFLFVLSVPIMLNIDYILNIWLGDIVPEHTANFVVLVIITNFMNNLNAPISNVVYATGMMKKYELTFSIINILIIPFSYIVLMLGAPAEAAFITYLIMTIFVQIGCLLVLRSLVDFSLRHYLKYLILPIILLTILVFPLMYAMHSVLPTNILGLGVEYILIAILTSFFFYYIVLDMNEKEIVKTIIGKYIKR